MAEAQKNSPAAAAGVKSGDVITAVDGEAVADPHELARRIAALGPKKTAKLSIVRNGSPMTIDVTLGTMPADKTASADTRNSDDNGGGLDARQARADAARRRMDRTASSSPRSIPTAPRRTRA